MPSSNSTIPNIRPITDLRTQINDILAQTSETNEPIILTKNGVAACVIMSAEALRERDFHARIVPKLREGEILHLRNKSVHEPNDAFGSVKDLLSALNVEDTVIDRVPTFLHAPGSLEISIIESALEDTGCITAYLASEVRSPSRISELMQELHSAFSRIAEAPYAGRIFQDVALDRTYRYVSLKDMLIFYAFEDGGLKVWRAIHPSQDVDRLYSLIEL